MQRGSTNATDTITASIRIGDFLVMFEDERNGDQWMTGNSMEQ